MPWFVPWLAKLLILLRFLRCTSGCDPDEVTLLRQSTVSSNIWSAFLARVRGPPRILFSLDNLAVDRDRLVLTAEYLKVNGHAIRA